MRHRAYRNLKQQFPQLKKRCFAYLSLGFLGCILILLTDCSQLQPNLSSRWITTPVSVEQNRFVDSLGRTIIFHGLFAIWKVPGGLPPSSATAIDGFTSHDAAYAEHLGFDAVRLAWFWEYLEPTKDKINTQYLNQYVKLAQLFADHRMFVIADSHQDMYSTVFRGDGFPIWSVPAGDTDRNPKPFPLGYLTSPVDRAFDYFWTNLNLQTQYSYAWETLSKHLAPKPWIIGYDLINEPFPGSDYNTCLSPGGCPKIDVSRIERLEVVVAKHIRKIDRTHIIFFEPNIFFNWGVPSGLTKIATNLNPIGLSFHDQCPERAIWEGSGGSIQPTTAQEVLCLEQASKPIDNAKQTSVDLGGAPFMTEFAPITNSDPFGLECILENADRAKLSWTYGLSWLHGELRHMTNEKLQILARPYPVAVAGVILSYSFDPRTDIFRLKYVTDISKVQPTALTIVEIPVSVHYPNGYNISVAGAQVVSSGSSSLLLLHNLPNAKTVTLTVLPKGRPVKLTNLPRCPSNR